MLSEVEGVIQAQNAFNYFSLPAHGFSLLFFSYSNQLINASFYSSTSFNGYNPKFIFGQVNVGSVFPTFMLIGDVLFNGFNTYTATGTFANSTMMSCTDAGIFCLQCTAGYNLYSNKCYPSTCPVGTLSTSIANTAITYCATCNRNCSTCTVLTSCNSCNASRVLTTDLSCQCTSGDVDSYGMCSTSCGFGFSVIYDTVCLQKCPNNYVKIGDWQGNTTLANISNNVSLTDSGSALLFSSSYSGLLLQAPPTLTSSNFPHSFTMAFWVYPTSWATGVNQTLIQAYNYIHVWKAAMLIGGVNYTYPATKIGNILVPDPINTTLQDLGIFGLNQWTFVGISKRRVRGTDGNDYAEIHVVASPMRNTETPPNGLLSDELASDFELTSLIPANLTIDTNPQQFSTYIMFGGDVYQDTGLPIIGTSFNGYLREFSIVKTYMGEANLLNQKYRAHSVYSQDLLSYWRFNEIAVTNQPTLLMDYTVNGMNQFLPSSSGNYPKFVAISAAMAIPLFRWDEMYSCWNPLNSTVPYKAGDAMVYNALATNGNYNIFDFVNYSTRYSLGDEIAIMNGLCSSGSTSIVAMKQIISSNSAFNWSTNISFSAAVPGNSYAFCFYSAGYDVWQHLNWIYIAQPPAQILPQNFLLYYQFQKQVQFTTIGGDEAAGNMLFLAKTSTDLVPFVSSKTRNVTRSTTGYPLLDFTLISPSLNGGQYNFYWQPSYSANTGIFTQVNNTSFTMILVPNIYFSKYF